MLNYNRQSRQLFLCYHSNVFIDASLSHNTGERVALGKYFQSKKGNGKCFNYPAGIYETLQFTFFH